METKKYELINETIEYLGRTLHRIKALRDFNDVKAGDLGGYIEKEENLSHYGNCWVYDNAKVFDNAEVFANAQISDRALIYGYAKVHGKATVSDDAMICDYAVVWGNVSIINYAKVCNNAQVFANAQISDRALICDNAEVYGNAIINGDTGIYNYAKVHQNAKVSDNASIHGNAEICDNAIIYGGVSIYDSAKIRTDAKIKKTSDYLFIKGLGSWNRDTTVYRDQNGGITVACGCFTGTLDKFEERVKNTHGYNKYAREYLSLINTIKIHFNEKVDVGYWREKSGLTFLFQKHSSFCSECNHGFRLNMSQFNYCPICGVRMVAYEEYCKIMGIQ